MLVPISGCFLPSNTLVPHINSTKPRESSASAACMRVAVEAMRRITLDNRDRIKSGDLSKLEKGIFYSHEYAEALSKHDAGKTRLKWLKDKTHLFNGYIQKGFRSAKDPSGLGGNKGYEFIIKDNITPSQALIDLEDGFSLLCCGEVYQIAYYHGIQTYLGKDKFDALFGPNSTAPLAIGNHSGFSNPLNDFFLVRETEGNEPVPVTYESGVCKLKAALGQMVYISGPSSYHKKHPNGVDQGMNALCVDEGNNDNGGPRFLGLGFDEPLNHEQICKMLLEYYNAKPIPDEHILSSEDIKKLKRLDRTSQEYKDMTWDEFYMDGGGRVFINELDTDRLAQLAAVSVQTGKQLLAQWRNE